MTLQVKIDPRITEIIARLKEAGYESYIVGGAVRDFLLDRKPKDYDLSTAATPEQIRAVFRDRRTLIIGRRFRLVHLFLGNDIIEISTFRRRPDPRQQSDRPARAANAPEAMIFHDNEFGTAEDDAHRRDFSVNAIFYDPVEDKLIDHTGFGLADIRAGIVRIIGEPRLRFEEDPVRILRALKLVGQYGFTLEETTEKALWDTLPLIVHASQSRMNLELEKILKNPYGDKILATFRKFGFLRYFLPYLAENYDTDEGRYVLELLAKRNERLLAGKYRDSISLAIAIFVLPFAEKLLGPGGRGNLFPSDPEMEKDLTTLMHKVFAPLTITKRAGFAAVRNMMFQNRLKELNGIENCVYSLSYPNAREFALIQNETVWHFEGFEEALPPPDRNSAPRRRRRRRGPRHKQQQNSAPRQFPGSVAEAGE